MSSKLRSITDVVVVVVFVFVLEPNLIVAASSDFYKSSNGIV